MMKRDYVKQVLQSIFILGLGMVAIYDLALHPEDGMFASRGLMYQFLGVLTAVVLTGLGTYSLIQLIWLRHLETTRLDLKSGQLDKALQNALLKWDKKHNVQNAVAVAAAYIYRGDGALGEQFALEAQRLAEREVMPPHLREMVWLALADAWIAQGRFNEAGYLMMEHALQSRRPNYFMLVAAFSYFLANNLPPTISTFNQVRTPDDSNGKWLPDTYVFMAVYLDYKLRGTSPQELKRHPKMVAHWDAEMQRNMANPYGSRLREIMDEIRTLIAA
jgi:hypothetical protein